MRKWARKIAVALSIGIVLTSGGFHFFSKAASSAIPRSKVLQGAAQSQNGDTNILLIGLDSRRDNEGNPIPKELTKLLRVGPASIGSYNTNTLILIHVPLLVALIAGDMIAGEAQSGTLRMLASQPTSRTTLILAKFSASTVYVVLLLLWMALFVVFCLKEKIKMSFYCIVLNIL